MESTSISWRTWKKNKETGGFKYPQSVAELKNIGGDLMLMIKNIDFTNVHNKFQEKLNSDITEIRNSSIVLVPADKNCNLYKIERL